MIPETPSVAFCVGGFELGRSEVVACFASDFVDFGEVWPDGITLKEAGNFAASASSGTWPLGHFATAAYSTVSATLNSGKVAAKYWVLDRTSERTKDARTLTTAPPLTRYRTSTALRAPPGLTANRSLTPVSRPVGDADKSPSAAGASCVAYQRETPLCSYRMEYPLLKLIPAGAAR